MYYFLFGGIMYLLSTHFFFRSFFVNLKEKISIVLQGMDDTVVPPSMTDFVHRILPGVAVHKLPYEGHFTYVYFCDECHRQIFTTLFGTPQGPLTTNIEIDPTLVEGDSKEWKETADEREEEILGDPSMEKG